MKKIKKTVTYLVLMAMLISALPAVYAADAAVTGLVPGYAYDISDLNFYISNTDNGAVTAELNGAGVTVTKDTNGKITVDTSNGKIGKNSLIVRVGGSTLFNGNIYLYKFENDVITPVSTKTVDFKEVNGTSENTAEDITDDGEPVCKIVAKNSSPWFNYSLSDYTEDVIDISVDIKTVGNNKLRIDCPIMYKTSEGKDAFSAADKTDVVMNGKICGSNADIEVNQWYIFTVSFNKLNNTISLYAGKRNETQTLCSVKEANIDLSALSSARARIGVNSNKEENTIYVANAKITRKAAAKKEEAELKANAYIYHAPGMPQTFNKFKADGSTLDINTDAFNYPTSANKMWDGTIKTVSGKSGEDGDKAVMFTATKGGENADLSLSVPYVTYHPNFNRDFSAGKGILSFDFKVNDPTALRMQGLFRGGYNAPIFGASCDHIIQDGKVLNNIEIKEGWHNFKFVFDYDARKTYLIYDGAVISEGDGIQESKSPKNVFDVTTGGFAVKFNGTYPATAKEDNRELTIDNWDFYWEDTPQIAKVMCHEKDVTENAIVSANATEFIVTTPSKLVDAEKKAAFYINGEPAEADIKTTSSTFESGTTLSVKLTKAPKAGDNGKFILGSGTTIDMTNYGGNVKSSDSETIVNNYTTTTEDIAFEIYFRDELYVDSFDCALLNGTYYIDAKICNQAADSKQLALYLAKYKEGSSALESVTPIYHTAVSGTSNIKTQCEAADNIKAFLWMRKDLKPVCAQLPVE